MLSRTLILAFLILPTTLQAVERETFNFQRFNELRVQGALILVDIYANWCPTCARQQVILDEWEKDHPDVPLHILKVNYTTQRSDVVQLRATRQSTFMLYHGDERIWYSVAETRAEIIHKALEAGLERVQ